MSRIDSPANPRIAAAIRAVARGDRMLLEGRRMIEDAIDAGIPLDEVFFVRSDMSEEDEDFLARVRGEGGATRAGGPAITDVSSRVLKRLSELPSTRGALALAPPPLRTLSSPPFSHSPSKKRVSSDVSRGDALSAARGSEAKSSLFVLLDDVQDPANVGAVVRSAEGFGAAGVLATPGSAWPFAPRALRASAGSTLRVPIAAGIPAAEAVAWARGIGATLAGAQAHGGDAPESAAALRPLVLVIGSEGHGLSEAVSRALDRRLTLPLAGNVESLNAAVAAGVLLFLLTRR